MKDERKLSNNKKDKKKINDIITLILIEKEIQNLSKKFLTRSFKLAKKEKSLKWYSSYEVIYDYFEVNYLNGYDKEEDMNNLLDYDLMILKAYRDYIESIEKNNDYLINCLFALISIIGITISLKNYEEVVCYGLILIGSYFAFILAIYIFRKTNFSNSYKIRVCNKIIYKLEDLK